jgi:hypothetical protein
MVGELKHEGNTWWIEGVLPYQVCEALFEAARVALTQHGAPYSANYIQGISAAAFRIGGICPCAPTCDYAMEVWDLLDLLGYSYKLMSVGLGEAVSEYHGYEVLIPLAKAYEENNKTLPSVESIDDPYLREARNQVAAIIAAVKDEIRTGRTAVLWHAFTFAEFDVVTGFNEDKGTFLGRGSYAGMDEAYAEEPQARTVTTAHIGGAPTAILIGTQVRDFDTRGAEIAALKTAVAHAHSQNNVDRLGGEEWVMLQGLACYDRWINDFRYPERKRGMGDAYCYGIYRSTHRAAAGFLHEIAPKYHNTQALLINAAQQFEKEADTLDAEPHLLGWGGPEGPDPERNARVVEWLSQARDYYAAGIDLIEQALNIM